MTIGDFLARLRWLDGTPMLDHVEPYRLRLFEQFFDERDEAGRPRWNLLLSGRAKKNWKSADLVIAAMFALMSEPALGYDAECSLLANDKDQAGDDLALAKRLVSANPLLDEWVTPKRDVIERKDGRGYLEILPAGDVAGAHGKSRRFVGWDEIHAYRDWDIFEAMQPDPDRTDAQQWITSYATLFHRPGVPLFDLMKAGRDGRDPRMSFSWYAADYTTDAAFAEAAPEARANPSMAGWKDQGYLEQQRRRLPSHKYRRLHLNLPGMPEGSAFAAESVMDDIERGVASRQRRPGADYAAFVDMSGGSVDDAVLGIAHRDLAGRFVLDLVQNQGPAAPFDPNGAVVRFVATLREWGIGRVVGDRYAGQTFQRQFESRGVKYEVCEQTKSQLYESLEPRLNGGQVVLLDVPLLEQQLLGLIWRGGRIDHPGSEHDDWANAAAGVVQVLAAPAPGPTVAVVRPSGDPSWRQRHF